MNTSSKSTALSADLNNFVYGVSRRNTQSTPELTKTGISLLKTFPAARDAVLEFFSIVFQEAVNVAISQTDYEADPNANSLLESVSMIGPELCNLGESWAPFIAPWCVNLIIDISTNKSNVPNSTLQSAEPVRVLLDITTQNLTLLGPEEKATCIDMMLESRWCGWAVGRVVRAEAGLVALVAPRALALGADAARALLAQLAHHAPALAHLKRALQTLFHDVIREDSMPESKRDVIPYLLNLASKSDVVLKAFTQDIEQTQHLLQKLEYECLFPDKTIPLLTSAAEEIHMIREKLLDGNQLEKYSLARLLILICYNQPSEFVSTISYLLQYSRDDATLALLVRIMSGTASMHVPNDTPDISTDTERYQDFIRTGVEHALRDAAMSDTQIKRCFIEGNVPKDQKTYMHYFCLNIIKLLRWESSKRVSQLRGRAVGRAVQASLYRLGAALQHYAALLRDPQLHHCTMRSLNEMPTCHALAEVLDRVDMSGTKGPLPSVESVLKVVQATVKYFFRCIHEPDVMNKVRGTQTACRLLRKLCGHSKLARAVGLRDLLEAAMFREERAFGTRAEPRAPDTDDLLIHLNQKHGPITQLTQSHTSVFHAGIIGKGVRKKSSHDENSLPPILTTNNELLMGALMACMDGNSGVVEGATSVALLLVELVSPDVMYNGLPWPDEDFTKQVSIERELYMRAALEASPVCRAALRRCGGARPALCLASALLRAAAATLLHRLRALLDRHTHSPEVERERATLTELLSTMTLGQLLPHPLSHMLELAPELTPNEIVQVLRDCLWNYTRDHVPSPALFTCDATGLHWRDPSSCKPPALYTDTLRIIIQKRIAKLGHLYPIMFLNLEKESSN
ncbi:integrator complex subunit 5 isoform X2 [Bombyx mori]|uniref:Integrator complex subunit 5 n=1 Tax=Bombyx mori TaxID=7091 RepID=A0A8R2R8U4_BOMMO|nr:integrator complex subunit 5 isoform X2 [Bombyx mori]